VKLRTAQPKMCTEVSLEDPTGIGVPKIVIRILDFLGVYQREKPLYAEFK